MALVRSLKPAPLEQVTDHSEVECTFTIVVAKNGERCLQLDTYGSKDRQIIGKKSQSLRLAPEALQQIKAILAENGL